jgi:hypothetical protein
MQGLIDSLPVGLMFMLGHWPFAAAAAAVLVAGVIVAASRGRWCDARRRRVAGVTFIVMIPVAAFAAFRYFGGGPGDLRYWLDWAFLAAVVIGVAGYAALLAWLFARPSEQNGTR